MPCVSPPELEDYSLLAHLEDQADDAVEEHLAHCTHCMMRADELGSLDALLRRNFYRITCPPSLAISSFATGDTREDERASIEDHLRTCPHCSSEVEQLRAYLNELEADLTISAVERIQVALATLISADPGAGALPAAVGLRGEPSAGRVFAADEARIAIEWFTEPDQPSRRRVNGLATGLSGSDWTVSLLRADAPPTQTTVDKYGSFAFRNVPPGVYFLQLSGPANEILIDQIKI